MKEERKAVRSIILVLSLIIGTIFLLFLFPGCAKNGGITGRVEGFIGKDRVTPMHIIGALASQNAMEKLSLSRGDHDMIVITNAGYAIIKGKTTEQSIDGLIAIAGCTPGGSNLVLVHRSKDKPLWFAFYKKSSKECVYLELTPAAIGNSIEELKSLSEKELFSKISKEKIGADILLDNPKKWNKKMRSKIFNGNEFSIIGIANTCTHPKSTYDLLQAAMFHNHICPGLTVGYLIIKYLDKNFPLGPGEVYKIITCPPWCKDDAFQAILDTTVGKRSIHSKGLTKDQIEKLPKNARAFAGLLAGLFIRWNPKASSGEGLALSFNWNKAFQLTGASMKDFKDMKSHKWWTSRLKMNIVLMDFLDKPDALLKTIKKFKLKNTKELEALQAAGVNPLERIGL